MKGIRTAQMANPQARKKVGRGSINHGPIDAIPVRNKILVKGRLSKQDKVSDDKQKGKVQPE